MEPCGEREDEDVPGHEAHHDVPPERIDETAPCPADLQLEGVVEREEDGVRGARGRGESGRGR